MPEGHLVHAYARQHHAAFAGRALQVTSPQRRFPAAALLDGGVLEGAEAWGKNLLYRWADGSFVHVHLGQRGLFLHVAPPAPAPRPQVRMRLTGDALVADLIAPRRCERIDVGERDAIVRQLGPDPLRPGADPRAAWRRIAASRAPIGALLLDQSILAGVGNVLRAEVLNIAGIDPLTPGAALSREEFDRLYDLLRDVMQRAAAEGRIVTRSPLPADHTRESVPEKDARFVYKQAHCRRCDSPVREEKIGGRTAYSCPVCQPRPPRR